MKIDYRGFIEENFLIKNKLGQIIPFKFNETQNYYYDMMLDCYGEELQGVRENILKFRQPGFSSLIDAMFTTDFIYSEWGKIPVIDADIVSAREKDTIVLFNRISGFLDSFFQKFSIDRKEYLEIDSTTLIKGHRGAQIYVQTANAKVLGRGGTKQNIHWCLGENTKIIRPNGLATSIKDIQIGDSVIAEDGSTTTVTNKWNTGIKDIKRIRLWYGNESVWVSPEHKIRTATRQDRMFGEPEWKQAKDLTTKDYVLWVYPKNKKCFSSLSIQKQKHCIHLRNNDKFNLDFTGGYFIGYYLAEGHIPKNLNNLLFTCHQDGVFYKKFENLFNTKPKVRIVSDKYGTKKIITYYSQEIATFVNSLVGRVENKNIPDYFLYKYPKSFLKGIYDGWKDGDGSKTEKDMVSIVTTREKIARQMRQLYAVINNRIIGLDFYENRKGYEKDTRNVYRLRDYKNKKNRLLKQVYVCSNRVNENNGFLYVRIKEIENVRPQQTYEIEVSHKSHAFLTVCGILSNSEVAFYPNTEVLNANTLVLGAEQQVADGIGKIFRETTGNTDVDFFAEEYFRGLEGKSEFKSRFLGWWLHKEYTKNPPVSWLMPPEYKKIHDNYGATVGQCYWHWYKVTHAKDPKLMMREYPVDDNDAFIGDGTQYFDSMLTKFYMDGIKPPISSELIYV